MGRSKLENSQPNCITNEPDETENLVLCSVGTINGKSFFRKSTFKNYIRIYSYGL